MQLSSLFQFSFNSYLERKNITPNNSQRCQVTDCPKLLDYMIRCNRDHFGNVLQRLQVKRLSKTQKLKLLMVVHYSLMNTEQYFERVDAFDFRVEMAGCEMTSSQTVETKFAQIIILYTLFIQKLSSIADTYKKVKRFEDSAEPMHGVSAGQLTQDAFVLLNLLKSTYSINRLVIFMGRYGKQTYPLVIDFTNIMSCEVARVFNHLLRIQKRLLDCFDSLSKQQEKLVLSIVDEMSSVRELVQYFIYNKYYHTFIDIESFKEVSVDVGKYKEMERKAYQSDHDEVDISNFESTYFTLASQNQDKRMKESLIRELAE